jgi:Protein of unknown function (DUF2934)
MTPEREERIRLRALEIWREQGCPEGRAREHWEQAERELLGDESKQVGGDQPTNQAVPDRSAAIPEDRGPVPDQRSKRPGPG